MSVLEVTIAIAIVSMILLSSASAFLGSLRGARQARDTSSGALFLQTVMEDLAAQPWASLTTFNGDQIYDQTTPARSNYRVDLSVFLASVDLVQIRAIVRDARTNREIGRLTTLRDRQ